LHQILANSVAGGAVGTSTSITLPHASLMNVRIEGGNRRGAAM